MGLLWLKHRTVWPYLQLMRPPNLLTAAADIFAGYAASGSSDLSVLLCLLLASIGLYGGGVVLNDVFDAKLDALERPERPIPSGRAAIWSAALLGAFLLAGGIVAASLTIPLSGVIALLIALFAVLYNAWGKHQPVIGQLNMGICRGLNLLLGISATPALVGERWYLALIPLVYIAAVTTISTGEVHGGRKEVSLLAFGLLSAVIFGLLVLTWTPAFKLIPLLPFLMLFAVRVLPAFWRVCFDPQPDLIRKAVKVGVLSLIILDAIIVAGYAGLFYGFGVLVLLFVADRMARLFAVT